ncbi:MAG: RDD family protein [Propionibacteriaceae bacterium]|nr:RDD family protein [Propionibacteriaceae bacterium]
MTDRATHPGASLGLPAKGVGSLATWGTRLGALVLDWGASMAVALGAFGGGVLTESGWKAWMILAVFFVQKAVLTALTGGSFGQLISGIGVTRTDGTPIGPLRALVRSALVSVVVPAVVIGADRRGLNDLLLDTVVVKRR